MRVAVTGSTGLIGSALVELLRGEGHDVVRLVRRPSEAPDEVQWDPEGGSVDLDGLAGIEGAVHLAGAGIGDRRWTESYKRRIRDSRTLGTRTLVRALSSLDPVPRVLVSGSGVHAYGDRGDEHLTEESSRGSGFLAHLVRDWEAEALEAESAGIRVALARTGILLSPTAGLVGQLKPLLKLGLGGPIGRGRNWWGWITLPDEVAALAFLLEHDVAGPVNLTGPEPERQVDVIRALARAWHRPAVFAAPPPLVRLAIGEFAGEITDSQRATPEVLRGAGFTFRHNRIEDAAAWVAS
jgi:uncharacterized protein (TIGR01777 family)